MTGAGAAQDHFLLYDIARGFLGLRGDDEILRYALMALIGSSGASFAACLEDDGDGSFAVRASRGLETPADLSVRLSRSKAASLERPASCDEASFGRTFTTWAAGHGASVVAPLRCGETLRGLIVLGHRLLEDAYGPADLELVAEIAAMAGLALREHDRPAATGRRSSVVDRLRAEHAPLRAIIGSGPAIEGLFQELDGLSGFDLPVLVTGETGTGKELVSRAVHELSDRSREPFEAINCAAIPSELIASVLFGHEKGAFTSAVRVGRGAFERAGAGTIFLDEIGDMSLEAQSSLLRVLQERKFMRVGGETSLPARARVITATNRDLAGAVAAGDFRSDLFYRIGMYTIHVPPLRERREDIPALVDHILDRLKHPTRKRPRVSNAFLGALKQAPLPGNVRELEGLVMSSVIRARGEAELRPEHLPESAPGEEPPAETESLIPRTISGPGPVPSYDEMERDYIRSILQLTDNNKKQAAAMMGIPRTTLNARMKKLGLPTSG